MKKLSLIYLVFLFVSCGTAISFQNPGGVYVCTFEHEFAKTEDTLLLQRINENYFKIIRHSGVTNKKDNKKKMVSEVWKLAYDDVKKAFTELKRGRTIFGMPMKIFWFSETGIM